MISIEHDFHCAADALWAILGDPGRSDWVAGVEDITFDGEVRRMQMEGAGIVAERILLKDDDIRRLEYQVIESTPPLAEHLATMQIDPTDSGCRLTWTTKVDPEAVEPFIKGSMKICLQRLAELI